MSDSVATVLNVRESQGIREKKSGNLKGCPNIKVLPFLGF